MCSVATHPCSSLEMVQAWPVLAAAAFARYRIGLPSKPLFWEQPEKSNKMQYLKLH